MNLLRRKHVSDLQAEAARDQRLKRVLGPTQLVLMGIGCVIGTGIFVLTGTVAAQNAGPAVVLSFTLAGLAAVFAALCYSEFASLVPMSGSAYTYSYTTLGEFFAWVIGWDLILEYGVGATTVAIGWSGYFVSFLASLGIHLPPEYCNARHQLVTLGDGSTVTGIINIPAILIVAIATALLVFGIRETARFNNITVSLKLFVIMLFLGSAVWAIQPALWTPFIPPNTGVSGHFGWSGVMTGAGIVFFAYVGFDAVSTLSQEAKNPRRDMPIGIIGSLAACTVLYILVAAVATGVISYTQLNVPDPIAKAADAAGIGWIATLIELGAVAGLSSVVMVMLLGQSRIFCTMAHDGLLPEWAGEIHARFHSPWKVTLVIGVLVALFSSVLSVREAGSLCSIGTLLAFFIVCIGVLILRVREPEHDRAFRVPAIWLVAPAGAASALYLMISLPWTAWARLVIWFVIGMAIYFTYGVRHSKLAKV